MMNNEFDARTAVSIATPAWDSLRQSKADGKPVAAKIVGVGPQLLLVSVEGAIAKLPRRHFDSPVGMGGSDLLGTTIDVVVTTADEQHGQVRVTRGQVAKAERRKTQAAAMRRLSVGAVMEGTVLSCESYGVFVDVGGAVGLVHRSELAWDWSPDAREYQTPGTEVGVKVLGLDHATGHVSLSIRHLQPDPWVGVEKRFPVGRSCWGEVVHLHRYGAFLRLDGGVIGLLHRTQIVSGPDTPHGDLSIGDRRKVIVAAVDVQKRHLSLSLPTPEQPTNDVP